MRWLVLLLLPGMVFAAGPEHKHKQPEIQDEFKRVYNELNRSVNLRSVDRTTRVGSLSEGSTYYLQVDYGATTPPSGDCDADDERGLLFLDHTNHRLYVCNGASRGWDYSPLTN